jgi:6-phosphogluconolactonase (cycloisomerase 2 family)
MDQEVLEEMTKLRFIALVGLAGLGSVAAAVGASASWAVPQPSTIVGHVYVNDNTPGVNTVAAFDRHADGSLTPLPGSPFVVGGVGAGHADASQGSLQLSADGRYLLAVDAGSNEISVVRIMPDGSLRTADVVSSNGGNPVSIAVDRQLVYVANADAGNPNYTGFALNPGGRLKPILDSTVSLPAGSQPGDILFSGDGTKLVGTRVGTSLVDSFTISGDGLLTAAPGSPFEHQSGVYGQFGSEFNPVNPAQLFVSNAHTAANGPAPGSVSAYSDALDGTLAPIGSSPFANGGVASCWVEISHDGRYLFTVNTASSTVASYSIGADGALAAISDTPIKNGKGAEDARLSPDGSTLWVVNGGADTINAFSVDGGMLSELAGSPTAARANATPSGIVVT